MWKARARLYGAVAPRSLDEVRDDRRAVALRCTMRGCVECASYEVERQHDFESTHAVLRDAHILAWDCSRDAYRGLAMAAGADELPCYIVLERGSRAYVLRPS